MCHLCCDRFIKTTLCGLWGDMRRLILSRTGLYIVLRAQYLARFRRCRSWLTHNAHFELLVCLCRRARHHCGSTTSTFRKATERSCSARKDQRAVWRSQYETSRAWLMVLEETRGRSTYQKQPCGRTLSRRQRRAGRRDARPRGAGLGPKGSQVPSGQWPWAEPP